jgi:hypothetical protein
MHSSSNMLTDSAHLSETAKKFFDLVTIHLMGGMETRVCMFPTLSPHVNDPKNA